MNAQSSKVLYAGSFDPITLGHVDIVKRLANLFDEVVVLVADSSRKNYFLSKTDRLALTREALASWANVRVDLSNELTVEYARKKNITVLCRSLRTATDWDHEATLSLANKKLNDKIETVFLMADPSLSHISSTLVREIFINGGSLVNFVPSVVLKALEKRAKS